jgi:hypothetical protein
VQIFGALLSSGVVASIATATRFIVRDVLDYKWKRSVLKRAHDEQVVDVARALKASRPDTRK